MIKFKLDKWDAFVVAIISIVYGLQLYLSPHLLNGYKAYAVINYLFDSKVFGIAFIALGVFKMLFILTNKERLRVVSIVSLGSLWVFFFTGFVLSPVANSLWILPLSMFLLCVGIALKELGD